VLFWVCFIVIWVVFIGLVASAWAVEKTGSQYQEGQVANLSNYSNFSKFINNTEMPELQLSTLSWGFSFIGNVITFSLIPEVAVINLLLFAISIIFGVYILITFVAPGGGG